MSFRNARIYRKRHSTERPRSFSSPLVIRSGLIPKTASPQNVSMSTMGILQQLRALDNNPYNRRCKPLTQKRRTKGPQERCEIERTQTPLSKRLRVWL